MTAEKYMIICYASFVLTVVSFAITIILFIKFNIISIIGDLSGSAAKKGIESIRNNNFRTGNKAYKSSTINTERGRITDRISSSGALKRIGENIGVSVGTERLQMGPLYQDESESNNIINNDPSLSQERNNENANYSNVTVFDGNQIDDTVVLSSEYEETTVLKDSNCVEKHSEIVVEDEIIYVHSREHIE